MKQYLILIGLILVFNFTFCQNRVFNYDSTISFIPIQDWNDVSDGKEMIYIQPLQSTFDFYNERVHINKFPNEGLNLDEYWKKYVTDDYKYQFEDFYAYSVFDSYIDNKRAKGIIFTNKLEGITLKSKQYSVENKGFIYLFFLITTEKNYPKVEPLFEKMVESIKIY